MNAKSTRRQLAPFPARVACAAGVAVLGMALGATSAAADTEVAEPDTFTSAFTVMATPDAVINGEGDVAPGEEGATGEFTFRVNSDLDVICWDITLNGVTGDYESPARTATHIHEAAVGEPGPPRLAFPNPAPVGDGPRTSEGCMEGPFTTGVESDAGADTGEGFTLAQLEANPAGFTGDSHTVDFPAGVVRGQLTQVPVGGLDTGGGGTAADEGSMLLPLVGAGVLAVGAAAGLAGYHGRRSQA